METETTFTARYAETDQMGIIHHSKYPVWFEAGRTDFFKSAGIPNKDIEVKGVLLPLYEMNCKFVSPAMYEDEIMVITSIKALSRARISFSYQVLNALNNKLLATGETMHALTDKALKPISVEKRIPEVYSVLSKSIK